MKKFNYSVITAVSVLVTACGGGSSGTESPPAAASLVYSGYAVDDYVIGGKVEFKDMASAQVLATTTTGAMGKFSAPIDPSLNYMVTITGGVLDSDGDPATTHDQQTNASTIRGVVTPEIASVVQIFSAATTGIAQHANGDAAKYVSNVKVVNDVFPVLVSTPSEINRHLNTVMSVQNRIGFANSVAEFADDGTLNGSEQMTAQSVKAIAESGASAASLNIKDPLLFGCIEEALDKQGPSLADLESITKLNCSNRAIYSLDGIQQLKNLGSLVLRDNAITDVSPLAQLGKLTYLDLADNRIAGINALTAAAFVETPLANVSNNCIASLPTTTNIEVIQTGTQRSTCNKVVRDSLLFNVSRQNVDSILMIYRIPANSCAMEYSSILGAPLVCDNRVHRQVFNVASTGTEEYVRLNVDGQIHGVYLVMPQKIPLTSSGLAILKAGMFELIDNELCYVKNYTDKQISSNEYEIAETQYCLNAGKTGWVLNSSAAKNRITMLLDGTTLNSNESISFTSDAAYVIKNGGVIIETGALTGSAAGSYKISSTQKIDDYRLNKGNYIYNHANSIAAMVQMWNVSNGGGWLSMGSNNTGWLFNGTGKELSNFFNLYDITQPFPPPICDSQGICVQQKTPMATARWTRTVLPGGHDVLELGTPAGFTDADLSGESGARVVYVMRASSTGDTGVLEGRRRTAGSARSFVSFSKTAFDAILLSKGLPSTIN